ncbi:MAG: hypothetical protein WDW36_008288 [Sanguina aurantia]
MISPRVSQDVAENAFKAKQHASTAGWHEGKGGGVTHKRPSNLRDPGATKKGGGGGKFTWGSLLTNGSDPQGRCDKRDPNYDSDEEAHVALHDQHSQLKLHVTAYKRAVQAIVEEFFDSADIADVASSLEDLGVVELEHYFVKRLITASLDRNDREREMASVLLSSLYAEVLPPAELQKGFLALIEGVDDLQLDVPAAPDMLATFLARAVADDILPPAIVTRIPEVSGSLMCSLKSKAEAALSSRHVGEKMERCWGPGADSGYQGSKAAIAKLLGEYVCSHDAAEAARCLQALSVPFFHHELVKQAVQLGMGQPAHQEALVALLARLTASGEVTVSQMSKGLARVAAALEDSCLDNPRARESHLAMMAGMSAAGIPTSPVPVNSPSNHHDHESAAHTGDAKRQVHSLQSFKHACNASVREYFTAADVAEVAEGLAAHRGLPIPTESIHSQSPTPGTPPLDPALWETPPPAVHPPHTLVRTRLVTPSVHRTPDAPSRRSPPPPPPSLSQLSDPGLHHVFVKLAVSLAMDRKDRERELVSQLLLSLCPVTITHDQMAAGFTRVLASADDLLLDIPDAAHLLALFLGRAIVDELLPPAFLAAALPSLRADGLGVAVIRTTAALLHAPHGSQRLSNCWHGGALSLDQIREQIRTALEEFLVSRDLEGAATCLAGLNIPYFTHEVVAVALELGFEAEAAIPPLTQMLASLSSRGQISTTQMAKGFQRIQAQLGNEALDFAHARELFARVSEQGREEGWLQSPEE